jgi:hypothetical protein
MPYKGLKRCAYCMCHILLELTLSLPNYPFNAEDLQRHQAVSQQIHQLFIKFINYVW